MKKFSQRMLKVLLTLCMFAGQFSSFAFTISAESEDTINYVSLGDSMTNGYGFTGYAQGNGAVIGGEGMYGNDAYPNQFADWLASETGKTVNHSKLAVSATRAEDLNYLLGGREMPTDTWFSQVNHYSGENDNEKLAGIYQDAIREADIISMSIGNASFGAYLMQYVTKLMGVMGGSLDPEEEVDLEAALVVLNPEQKAVIMEAYNLMLSKVKEYDELGVSNIVINEEGKTLEDLVDIMAYIGAGFILNYEQVLEQIVELNPDVEVILVGLMNTTYGMTVAIPGMDPIPVGDIMDILFGTLNAYIAGLPAAMQATGKWTDATFYYAEQKNPNFIVEAFKDLYDANWPEDLNGLSGTIVRERTIKSYNEALRPMISSAFAAGINEGVETAVTAGVLAGMKNGVASGVEASAYGVYVDNEIGDDIRALSDDDFVEFMKRVNVNNIIEPGYENAVFDGMDASANTIYPDAVSVIDAYEKLLNSTLEAYLIPESGYGSFLPVVTLDDVKAFEISTPAWSGSFPENRTADDQMNLSVATYLGIEHAIANSVGTMDIDVGALMNIADLTKLMGVLSGFEADLSSPNAIATSMGEYLTSTELLSSMCKIYGMFKIGDGMSVHPTPYAHELLADEIIKAYSEGYTAKDETIKNAEIAFDYIADLVEKYGPTAAEEAYKYAEENGYIDQFEAAVVELKAEIEEKIAYYSAEAKPLIEAEIAKLEAKLADLEVSLENLKVELAAKKAELEAKKNELVADVEAATIAAYEKAIAQLEKVCADLEALAEQVEAQIAAVEAKIAELKASLAKVDAKVAELTAAIANLDAAIAKMYDSILNASDDANEAVINAVKSAKAAVEAAVALVDTIYDEFGAELNAVVELLKSITIDVEALYETVTVGTGAVVATILALPENVSNALIGAIEEVTNAAQATIDALWAQANEQIEVLNKGLAEEIEKVVAKAQEQIDVLEAALEAKIAELNAELAAEIEAVLAEVEGKIAELEAEAKEAAEAAVAELKAQLAVLEAELAELNAQLENCAEEAKAEIEAKAAEIEAQIAALKAEIEAKVAEATAEITAQIAALKAQAEEQIATLKNAVETQIATLKAEVEAKIAEINAEVEAQIAALKAEVEAKIAEITAVVEAKVAEINAEVEEKLAMLDAVAESVKNEIVTVVAGYVAELEAAIEELNTAVENHITEEVAKLTAIAEALYAEIEEKVDLATLILELMYDMATSSYLWLADRDDYVALGDESAMSVSYVDGFAEEIEKEYGINLEVTNLAEKGATLENILEVVGANAETIADAELITLGYGNVTFADAAMNAMYDALRTGNVPEYDWAQYVGEEGAPYIDAALDALYAEMVAAGLDVVLPLPAMGKASLATAMAAAVETFAYQTAAYAANLPKAIAAVRAVNPYATVIVVGMNNPFRGTTLTYGDVSIELGKYVEALVEVADIYGTGLCMMTGEAIYVAAGEADTDVSNVELEATEFLFAYFFENSIDMTPNETGHAYIKAQLLEALSIELNYLLGDVNLDGKVQAVDAALAYRIANGQYQATKLQQLVADVTGDGKNQALDAALIYRYANNQLDYFPAGY